MGDSDAFFMEQMCHLAQEGKWQTFPNPNVGACLVQNETIVARGYHHGAGQPHAEVVCLNDARARGIDPSGCTLYVTLEPCNHYGKTPPCTKAILEARIPRVVFGCFDPNPEAQGGAAYLRSQGVSVEGPVSQERCRTVLQDFLVWQEEKRPYVLLKMAETMDGRIATRTNQSQWISGEAARNDVQYMRRVIGKARGAVLIGGNTFRLDNPKLTARTDQGNPHADQPKAIILTSHLPDDPNSFTLLRERPCETIFCTQDLSSPRAQMLQDLGITLEPVPQKNGQTDFLQLFQTLFARYAFPYILCEGGGILGQNLLTANLVDEMHLYLAPLFLCDNEAKPLFTGSAPTTLQEGIPLETKSVKMVGDDIYLLIKPKRIRTT